MWRPGPKQKGMGAMVGSGSERGEDKSSAGEEASWTVPATADEVTSTVTAQQPSSTASQPSATPTAKWQFMQTVKLPEDGQQTKIDFILGPETFEHARIDLADLRLFDENGSDVPYALRVLRSSFRRDTYPASEFNRGDGPDNSRELVLDLGEKNIEHNGL